MSSVTGLPPAEGNFLHPDVHGSSDSGSPLSDTEQAPIQPLSRLPRLARSPGPREKQAARFNPYARTRKPRASLAVRVDSPRKVGVGNTGLPTPISPLRHLGGYDYESEAEVSMICGDGDDDEDGDEDSDDEYLPEDVADKGKGKQRAAPSLLPARVPRPSV